MQMARDAGIPVPKVLSCGLHYVSHGPQFDKLRMFSILMTRLPGICLVNFDDTLDAGAEDSWLEELKQCVDAMRQWSPPDENSICSPIGTAIRSSRVPHHIMGPFPTVKEFYDHLFGPVSSHGFKSRAEFEETLLEANKLRQRPHRLTFTHGDFKAHNIMVGDDGHLSGFLDWEYACWQSKYWKFTTAMRFGLNSWWYQVASWMGGDQYLEELAYDRALNLLTVDSYIAF